MGSLTWYDGRNVVEGKKSKKGKESAKFGRWPMCFIAGCFTGGAEVTTALSSITYHCAEQGTTNGGTANQANVPVRPGHTPKTTTQIEGSSSNSTIGERPEEVIISYQLQNYRFSELKSATRNFRLQNILGEGGFGRVFKGWVQKNGTGPARSGTGMQVAVKSLNRDGPQGHSEWLAEVVFLGELRHPHLVKLIGYCMEEEQRLLVYEYLPKGSLENHLFRRSQPLVWHLRMKILLGAAKGLAFLHEEAEKPVIYRDFKTANILLDGDYNAKLSDFGLAKDGPEGDKSHISTRVMGTYGYTAPEYVMTGHLSTKSDVYSFGVVVLEMLTGRRVVDRRRPVGQQNLVEWARPHIRGLRRFIRIIDPRLRGNFSIEAARQAALLARQCVDRDVRVRPRMSDVVKVLTPLLHLDDMIGQTKLQAIQAEDARASLARKAAKRMVKPLSSSLPTDNRKLSTRKHRAVLLPYSLSSQTAVLLRRHRPPIANLRGQQAKEKDKKKKNKELLNLFIF